MNLRNFMVVAGALLAVTSCQGEQSFEEDKVLGPAGTDVTQRPVTEPSHSDVVMDGCCFFDPGPHTVEELYGDHQAWRVSGENFELIFSYGASIEPAPNLREATSSLVDEVEVRSRPLEADIGEIPLLTAVLEASKMNGMEVVDPRLTVFGQCKTDQGCSDASDVLTSLRF